MFAAFAQANDFFHDMALAPAERPGIWQLGVVRGVNYFQLYGGSGVGELIAASSKVPRKLSGLHLYATLELAIALFGCTSVFGLPLLGGWIRPIFQTL